MGIKSWEVSDAFWEKEKQYKRKAGGGRKPMEARKVFSAIVFVLRTGIQWRALPKEVFGSPSAIHRLDQTPLTGGKKGTKRHILVDGRGVPLSIVVTGANRHDAGRLEHIRPRGEEKREKATNPLFQARRRVVEACHSWFNRFRKLVIRYEKPDETHPALTQLAAAIIAL